MKNLELTYSMKDFFPVEKGGHWNDYQLKKNCTILGRTFDRLHLSIFNIELSKTIDRINEHLNWLADDCEIGIELIEKFTSKSEIYEKYLGKWYEELEIDSVSIVINSRGDIFTEIDCSDRIDPWEGVNNLYIKIKGHELYSMTYNDCGQTGKREIYG
jgi:hypothetical protein